MSHARSLARRAAVQALYQWQIGQQNLSDIEAQFLIDHALNKADLPYFQELLHQIPAQLDDVERCLIPVLDRPLAEIDPVECAILRIGAYELSTHPELPCRVIINEAVQLAKRFGGDLSYKYVNGVLDKVARSLRPGELRSSS
jgi:N utilization substance protein B